MRQIRKLKASQIKDALLLGKKAYPMMQIGTEAQLMERVEFIKKDFNTNAREWYGLFEDKELLGMMVLYDFQMNYFGGEIPVRGIGFVAVDLLHKKQKVCKEMLHWYLADSRKKHYPLAALYAFRPDFYHKMGFGFGTVCDKYITSPQKLPSWEERYQLDYLNPEDQKLVEDFFQELYEQNHGMMKRPGTSYEALFNAPGVYLAGYKENGRLSALLIFRLTSNESTNDRTHMDLELLFNTPAGLKSALSFLNSQSDQVTRISFSTLQPQLYYRFADIRHQDEKSLREPAFHHTSDRGMGTMYRSLDAAFLLLNRPCTLDKYSIRFHIRDGFLKDKTESVCLKWSKGKASICKMPKPQVEISLEMAEFSSWAMNAIDLSTLYQYGLLEISDRGQLELLDRAFYYRQKPMCLEKF